jgi:hypothetical protein
LDFPGKKAQAANEKALLINGLLFLESRERGFIGRLIPFMRGYTHAEALL